MTVIDQKKRYSRQQDLVKLDKLTNQLVSIVGVGAIGRQVALQLAAMGVPSIQLVDFDVVEDANLAPQGFIESDLGKSKVEAVAQMCRAINSSIKVGIKNEAWFPKMELGKVVFCCVDDIEVRGLIFKEIKDRVDLFVDGRMARETMTLLTAYDKESKDFYPTTLFTKQEAYQGACTAKSTIYTSNIIAGLMVGQLTKWTRGAVLEKKVDFNLLTMELSVNK